MVTLFSFALSLPQFQRPQHLHRCWFPPSPLISTQPTSQSLTYHRPAASLSLQQTMRSPMNQTKSLDSSFSLSLTGVWRRAQLLSWLLWMTMSWVSHNTQLQSPPFSIAFNKNQTTANLLLFDIFNGTLFFSRCMYIYFIVTCYSCKVLIKNSVAIFLIFLVNTLYAERGIGFSASSYTFNENDGVGRVEVDGPSNFPATLSIRISGGLFPLLSPSPSPSSISCCVYEKGLEGSQEQ